MFKIDTHVHGALAKTPAVNGNSREPDKNYVADSKELRRHLEKQEIGKAILMSGGESSTSIFANNEECKAICKKEQGFFSWMCNFDSIFPETVFQRMETYQRQGAVGIGELIINEWMDSPMLSAIFTAAERLQMPVTAHFSPEPGMNYGICDHWGLPLLERVLEEYPKLIFVGHSQPFWMEISGDCPKDAKGRNGFGRGTVIPGGRIQQLMNQYPNLYGDLSAYSASAAILRDEAYGIAFLETFQNRLLFATDTMNQYQIFPLGQFLEKSVREGRLSRQAYENICYYNAKRVYDI